MQQELSRLRGLASLGRALGRRRPLLQLLELAAEEACRILPATSCSISRSKPAGRAIRTVVNVGELGPGEVRWPEAEYHPMPEFGAPDVTADATVVWCWAVDDQEGTPEQVRALLRRFGKQYAMCAPILVDGHLWGEMWTTRTADRSAFDVDDTACMEALLAILSGALSRAEREETLSELAYRDPLTDLLNRRAIDDRALYVFDVPAGERREVTALALDINGLKTTNDRDGHQAGDRLIIAVAEALGNAFAEISETAVARVGGDEFHVLACGVPTAEVVRIADRLVEESWRRDPGTALSCGACGAVLTAESALTPTELFAEADRAQYVAKRERRRSTAVCRSDQGATAARSGHRDAPAP